MDAAVLNQTNTSTSTSCTVESSVEKHMYPAAYSLFFIVGFPANCLSLYVAWRLIRNGNTMAVYLINLSISDLLYTISLPVWIELALQKPLGGLCSLVAVIMYNSFYVGSGLLCCISVDRYLAVVYPLHFHWVREVRTAAVQIMQSLRESVSILEKERRKVGLLLMFLLVTYIVAFVPYQTVMLLRAILEPGACVWASRLRDPYLVTVATTTINSTLDPIIYCLISENAQKEIRKAVEKGRGVFMRIWSESSTGIQSVS
ncbi:G-protein coupled receptor 4-like [Enoplosus armatus]|uniref:G-protein coupled receptor 4-like n=1 Tax=Enoplosus armatus TaxID=215367 RepID=UPI0039950973